jgi:hypothetical protein
MIGNPADAEGGAVYVVERHREVRMQFRSDRWRDERFPVFRAENQVNQDAGKGLGHGCVGYNFVCAKGA